MTGRRISLIASIAFAHCCFVSAASVHAAEGGNDANDARRTSYSSGSTLPSLRARIDLVLWQIVATDFPQATPTKSGRRSRRRPKPRMQPTSNCTKQNRNLRNSNRKSRSSAAIAQREAAAEAERIRNATLSDAEKIEAAAAAEIEAAERAARLELKALAANLAVDNAESLLAKQLTPQAQEALVSAFVKGLAGRPN